MQLAVQHSFTANYTKRHQLDLPPEAQACLCGFTDRSINHLLYDCVCYEPRRRYPPFLWWHLSTVLPDKLFGLHAYSLLLFLQETGAASRPEVGPIGLFDPG